MLPGWLVSYLKSGNMSLLFFSGLYLEALSRPLTRHEASGGLHTLAFSPLGLWFVHGSGQTIIRNGDSGACLHFLACRTMMVSMEALVSLLSGRWYVAISGSPASSLALNPEYFCLLWSRRHVNTGSLSFNLIWCGCYFNSPQKAPVGL